MNSTPELLDKLIRKQKDKSIAEQHGFTMACWSAAFTVCTATIDEETQQFLRRELLKGDVGFELTLAAVRPYLKEVYEEILRDRTAAQKSYKDALEVLAASMTSPNQRS